MKTMPLGWRAYGLGVMALGIVCFASGDFVIAQPLPAGFPHRTALALATAAFLLVAGAAVEWRRTTTRGAAALTVFYALVVVLMDGTVVIANYAEYGTWSGVAEQVAIMAGGLIVYAASAKMAAAPAARLTRAAQMAFGICAVLFGGAHFVYMNLTAPLVPRFLPPSQEFWAWATGVGHIAAGIAILTGVQARVAAIMLTGMYASFTPLVHLPMLLADPWRHANWTENAINLALTGTAWVVADSLARTRRIVGHEAKCSSSATATRQRR
jgi:uncharacterized membrane protein YphA (DoxX/SURF4 family)